MATTVTYKGQTLATVENQTKTLQTAGKWCEDDFTLTDVSGGGTTEPEEKDVDFIDYDGTLLYSYTADEFLQMTELPPNPTREGLVAQGWNWTLADAKEVVEECGAHSIGQMYDTVDGKTRIYITIDESDNLSPQYVRLTLLVNPTTVVIDWGDGSEPRTETRTSGTFSPSHTYSAKGNYVITIDVTDGDCYLGYYGSNMGLCWENSSSVNSANSVRRVRRVEVGHTITMLGNNPFLNMGNLESVSLHNNIINNNNPAGNFNSPCRLKGLVLPSGMKSVSFSQNIYALERISFPNGMERANTLYGTGVRKIIMPDTLTTSPGNLAQRAPNLERVRVLPNFTTLIGVYDMLNNISLTEVTIPATITAINANAFNGCRLTKIHMKPTTPPTLANTNAFPNFTRPGNIITVPYSEDHSVLTAYQTATNWSTYASYMEEEPA